MIVTPCCESDFDNIDVHRIQCKKCGAKHQIYKVKEICILNCDSPSYPPEIDEYLQCSCSECWQTYMKLKTEKDEGKPMNRFYTTTSPDSARHILLETEKEAIEEARNRTTEDNKVRYVVQIIYKVEPEKAPVKVTKIGKVK